MRTYRTFLILLVISLFTISCGDKKSNSSKKSESVKRAIESKLSLARNSFVEKELRPMKKELEFVLKQLNEYRTYEQSVRSLNALPMVELKKTKTNFLAKYGEEAKLVKGKVAELKNKITKNKETLVEIRKDLQKKEIAFNEQKTIVEGCFESLSKQQKTVEKEIGKRKNSIENSQNSITSTSKKAEKLAKKTIKKGGIVRVVYTAIIQEHGKYLTALGKSLEQNKKFSKKRTKTSKLKGRLKKTFVQFDKIEALIRKVYKQSRDLTKYAKNQNNSITKKHKQCEKKQTTLLKSKDEIESLALEFEEEKSNLDKTTNELVEFVKAKEPFYSAYNEYKVATEKLNGKALGSLEDKRLLFEMSESRLVKKYSKNYLKIYSEVVKWVTSNSIDGKNTIDLLNLIDRSMHSSREIINFKTKIVKILALANKSQEKVGLLAEIMNFRSIANFLGIKTPSFSVKISLPKIDLPKIKLPKIKIPKIEINLPKFSSPNLNFDLDLNIQEINLPKIEIANIDISNVVDIDLGELEVPNIEIEIPEVPVVSSIITKLGQLGESFIDDITSIEIAVPKVEIVRIEADVEKDLKAPENLIKNTLLQIKDAKEDVDRELTNASQGLKRESDKAIADTQREVGNGLKTVGAALEAAGQPKNLARIAVVYAATLYAGPYGAALANTLLDKMENPGMSEEDMLKSFAIGLAAGKAAEYVGGPSMNYSQAQQSVVRNLTRDLGEIALSGRPYRAEDFFTSLATGATTLEGSDSYTERIMNSAIASGKDYSLRQAITHGDIDPDELSKQMATGLAQGTMTELVHGYIDANHKVALNQRVDLKLEEEAGEFLKEIFSAVDEDKINAFNQMYENLTPTEARRADELVKKEYQEFLEFVADNLGKDVSELTAQDFQSPAMAKLIEQYQIKIANSESGENPELDEIESLLNKEGLAQKDGRNPAFMKYLMASMIIVQVYMIGETAADYVEKYEKHIAEGGTPESFQEKYGADIAIDASVEVASIIPVMKVLKGLNPKQISRVINAAEKLGYKTKEQLSKFADFTKYIAKDQTGAIGNITKRIDDAGDITSNAATRNKLFKQLATESQIAEKGTVIAGKGSNSVFRNAEYAARKYGGHTDDYVKKSSSSVVTPDGYKIETHWVENITTGQKYEAKTIMTQTKLSRSLWKEKNMLKN